MSGEVDIATKRLRLKIALEELREMKGFGTELVTIIIPPDRQISDARTMLQNEHGQAANIKSKGTRKNVQGAIESAISTLNRFKTPGENGIAVFVGAIIIGNNKTRMVNVVIEDPPQQLLSFRYRCDSTFELTQLEDMLVDKKSYALFVIDRAEAAYGIASESEYMFKNILFQTSWANTGKVVNLPKDSSALLKKPLTISSNVQQNTLAVTGYRI